MAAMPDWVEIAKDVGPAAAGSIVLSIACYYAIPPFEDWNLWQALPLLLALAGLAAFNFTLKDTGKVFIVVLLIIGLIAILCVWNQFNWLARNPGPLVARESYLRRSLAFYLLIYVLLGFNVGCITSLMHASPATCDDGNGKT